ncbi:hypothetical protein Pint_31136 [Pistacia integerrima]|uniref:Uncharacterized protein n=1 Tax=Pistacia integerrima TaxID=434235 RepID=A0ACC0XTD4_9ROSI|nr:hypothetical protein Pint_31136 [Pistacia integerrima]
MPKNDRRKAPTKDSATGMVAADSLGAAAAGVGTDAEGPGAGAGANTSFFAIVAVMEAARMRTAHKIIFISMAKRLSKLVK